MGAALFRVTPASLGVAVEGLAKTSVENSKEKAAAVFRADLQ